MAGDRTTGTGKTRDELLTRAARLQRYAQRLREEAADTHATAEEIKQRLRQNKERAYANRRMAEELRSATPRRQSKFAGSRRQS